MSATRIEAPRAIDEAIALLRHASVRGETVAIAGGGTKAGVGYPAADADVLLRTTLLDRVVEYAPADLVVEVEAGATIAALQSQLAPHRQRLALDPPEPERATIGGLLATNTFGPRRARFGSLRDLIVGISLVRADGARVRGGGKVVKNVAGFDLPKIAVGSLGSLGLIATATFRLHPIPESTRAVCVADLDAGEVRALVAAIVAARIEPTAVVAHLDGDRYACFVAFEGFESGVAEQIERFAAVAAASDSSCSEVPASAPFAIDNDARTFGEFRLRAAVPPAAFEALHRNVCAPFVAAGERSAIVAYPTLGIAFASGFYGDSEAFARAILAMRRSCEAIGGNLEILANDRADLAQRLDPYGTLPGAYPIMRRLKDRFDPGHRINRGRFIGKL
jgi:glycolate oxidase FAD binding subunit